MDPILEEKKFVWHKPTIIMMSFLAFALVMGCITILVSETMTIMEKVMWTLVLLVVVGGIGVWGIYTNLCVVNGDCNKLALANAIIVSVITGLIGIVLLAITVSTIAGTAPPRVRMPLRMQSIMH